jgi:hypothetical protein
LFWLLYAIYFYLQGISPDCVKGLDPSDVYYYAFTSAVCFLPGCVASVYVFLYILDPHFLKKKNYWGFFAGTGVLLALVVGMNYFFSLLFFRLSCHCDVAGIPATRIFAEGFLNSQNAMIAGGVALGAKLAAGGYYQKLENLKLARVQTASRLEALKAKAQPDYLLCQLESIAAHIRARATDPPVMILQLSGLLHYWLYEGAAEAVPLEEEIAIVQYFLQLETARRSSSRVGKLWVEGKIQSVTIAPMILLPLVQAASNCSREDGYGGALHFLQLRLVLQGTRLSFRLDRAYPLPVDESGSDEPPAGKGPFEASGLMQRRFESSGLVQGAIARLESLYPGLHTLDIGEEDGSGSGEGNGRRLHLALDMDVSNTAPVQRRRRQVHSLINLEANEPF